jgi:hypothetical protein
MSFYYLVAGLPAITLDAPPTIGMDEFLARCAEYLSPAESARVHDAMRKADSAEPFMAAWRDRDCQIRNTVARHRARRLGRDEGSQLRPQHGYDLFTMRGAEEALAKPHPLEREMALDRLRWSVLEELAGTNMFALPHVIAYGMKLKLALRWSSLSDERGRQRVDEIVTRQMTGTSFKAMA